MPKKDKSQKTMNDFGFTLLNAIQSGLSDGQLPFARIDKDGSLVIMCKADNTKGLDELLIIFNEQCAAHGLTPISGDDLSSRTEKGEFVKYQFHVAPRELDALWVSESRYYSGYRNTGSILRLLEPDKELLKPGVICLFPVQDIGDNQFILRIANCNSTEVIATQLAFLIRKYGDQAINPAECYGHYDNSISQRLSIEKEELLEVALSCIGIHDHLFIASQDGSTVISLPESYSSDVNAMSTESTEIYSALGVVGAEELPLLKSIEVPVSRFLEKTIEHLEVEKDINESRIANDDRAKEHLKQVLSILRDHEGVAELQTELLSLKETLENKKRLPALLSELKTSQEELIRQKACEAEYLENLAKSQARLSPLKDLLIEEEISLEDAEPEQLERIELIIDNLNRQISILDNRIKRAEKNLLNTQSEIRTYQEKAIKLTSQIEIAQTTTVTDESIQAFEAEYKAAIAEPIALLEKLKDQYEEEFNQTESKATQKFLRIEIKKIETSIQSIKERGISVVISLAESNLKYSTEDSAEYIAAKSQSLNESIALARELQKKITQERQIKFKQELINISGNNTNNDEDNQLTTPNTGL